jgi:hypothetical protein
MMVQVPTINGIGANAKMNFRHEDCWFVFASMIKPQIGELMARYFRDWQWIERDVTAIYMKKRRMFTSRLIVTKMNDNEPDTSMVTDIDRFRRKKRMSFSHKLTYLKDKKQISRPMYDLLSTLAKRRNRIHEFEEGFTDDDRSLFNLGYRLLHATFIARCFESEKEHMQYQIEQNDKSALELLKLIRAQEASKFKGSLFADIDLDRVKGGWEVEKDGKANTV